MTKSKRKNLTGCLQERPYPSDVNGWDLPHPVENNLGFDDALIERLEDALDAEGTTITVAGATFHPHQILRDCDQVLYRQAMREQIDSMVEDGELVELDGEFFWREDCDKFVATHPNYDFRHYAQKRAEREVSND